MPLVADYGTSSDESDEEITNVQPKKKSTSLNTTATGLTTSPSSIKAGSSNAGNEDVLEDFVKKTDYGQKATEKPQVSSASDLSKLRLPAVKGKVKISIPILKDMDSDEDEPSSKKFKPSAGGASGFLGSLPPPKGALGGKELSRPLIPHSLTKPKIPQPNKSQVNSGKFKAKPKQKEASSDSDDESYVPSTSTQESVNFFSLDEGGPSSNVTANTLSSAASAATSYYSHTTPTAQQSSEQHAPKVTAASLYKMTDDVASDNDMAEDEAPNYESMLDQVEAGASSSLAKQSNELMDEQELSKFFGKKGRGKEDINFIDFNAEDMKASEIDLIKGLSEEQDNYSEKAKKGVGFAGKAKSKHQITWLAHQAKVREQELKNQWAANRQTRQQTQSKYGF